jgi:phospho-N-acetylmuramoyl-pentapeptide-transferase
MLYAFILYLGHHGYPLLDNFRYLTLRGIFAILTALFFVLGVGPAVIRTLASYKIGETVRDLEQLTNHHGKKGTPTMGGLIILMGLLFSTLLWANLSNPYIWIVLFVLFGFAILGGYDDFCKLTGRGKRGISAKLKFLIQSLITLIAVFWIYKIANPNETQFVIPFFSHAMIEIGAWYLVIAYFVVVGSSNAVNLTDGLDGLAIMPSVLVAGALGVFAYLTGNIDYASYLSLPYVQGTGELTIFVAAFVGSGLGFLWFNAYPAQVFMGDIGSLSIGASLGILAVIVREEIVFFIMSGVFVMETVSVILQVASFKMFGKRIFKMAPIHHHFELKGWKEPKIIVRFWIITLVLVLIGLATLKLR